MKTGEVRKRMAQFKAAARATGIKLTHQRLLIFGAVASSEEHPSADDIHQALRKKMPSLSLDTVYRSLWMLAGMGLLKRIGLPQDSVRFDANLGRHHHFRCERCGMIRDFVSSDLDSISPPSETEQFGKSTAVQVEVRGICKACLETDPSTGNPPDYQNINHHKE